MDRKQFLKTCGFACLAVAGAGTLLQSCATSKLISSQIEGSDLVVPLNEFQFTRNHETHFRKYIVVHNDKLEFPVCIYRFDDKNFSALYMRCTHQGAELQVFGDKLQCPAHGSEFDNKGKVLSSPADTNLRTFPVVIDNENLKISLK